MGPSTAWDVVRRFAHGPHAGLHSSEMQARAKSDSPHTELGGKAGLWGGKATEGASQSQSEGE